MTGDDRAPTNLKVVVETDGARIHAKRLGPRLGNRALRRRQWSPSGVVSFSALSTARATPARRTFRPVRAGCVHRDDFFGSEKPRKASRGVGHHLDGVGGGGADGAWMMAFVPVVSTTAEASSTPGALESAAATRLVASSRVAIPLRPVPTVRSASKVTSSSDIPSEISARSSVLAMADRLIFPVGPMRGIFSTSTRHCGHFAGGSLSDAC